MQHSIGVCWMLALYKHECRSTNDFLEHRLARATLFNMQRSLAQNPHVRACLITTMAEAQMRPLTTEFLDRRYGGRTLEWFAHVDVIHLPCTLPPVDANLRAALPGTRWPASALPIARPCAYCALAERYAENGTRAGDEHAEKARAMRYARYLKIAALAAAPYETTLLLDADVSLCAHALDALAGVAAAMRRLGASVGARLLRPSPRKHLSQNCDDECARLVPRGAARLDTSALGRATERHMRCVTGCLNRGGRDGVCGANTGVMVVRRSARVEQLSAAWHWRYALGLYTRSLARSPAGRPPFRDQTAFGDHGLSSPSRSLCAGVANLPLNLHLGRSPREVGQGQVRVRGEPIAVHACKKGSRQEGCIMEYECCLERAAACVGNATQPLTPQFWARAHGKSLRA